MVLLEYCVIGLINYIDDIFLPQVGLLHGPQCSICNKGTHVYNITTKMYKSVRVASQTFLCNMYCSFFSFLFFKTETGLFCEFKFQTGA